MLVQGWTFVSIFARIRKTTARQTLNITDKNKVDLERKPEPERR